MTVSTWGNAALASLLGSAAVSSGQGVQVMFVPLSSSSSTTASRPVPSSAAYRSAVNMDPFLFGSGGTAAGAPGEEPPCRQRRLEPWRKRVRELCRAEADAEARCAGSNEKRHEGELMEARDLRRHEWRQPPPSSSSSSFQPDYTSLMSSLSSPPMASLEREVDSFFEALFAPPYQTSGLSASPQHNMGMDPFDKIMSDMLDFSLRAFDEVMSTDAGDFVSPPKEAVPPAAVDEREEDEAEEEEDSSWSEDIVVVPSNYKSSNDQSIDEAYLGEDDAVATEEEGSKDLAVSPPKEAVPPVTEQEAEETDSSWLEDVVIVPSSYKSSNDMLIDEVFFEEEESGDVAPMTPGQAAENALDVMVASLARSAVSGSQDGAKEDAGEKTGREEAELPSVHNLPERLFRMGQDLLTEISARRRLSEEGGEVDPRLQVKKRLARRLTEYRTNLVYSPSSNSITLYTANVGPNYNYFPARSLVPAPPLFSGMPSLSYAPPLGMGSADADKCLRSQFDNGDLRGTECHRAVGELLLVVDHGSPESPHYREFATKSDMPSGQSLARYSVTTSESQGVDSPTVALVGLALVLAVVLLLNACFGAGYEEEEDGDEEDVDDFDYIGLSEDDVGEVHLVHDSGPREGFSGEGEGLVFVGVPVQVV